jgi:hypothetical protein
MTGEQLWTLFINAKVADDDLRSLGHDLYFARPAPRGDEANRAVNALAAKLAMTPKYAYSAMNTDPGRKTLEQMGLDYEKKRPFAATAESTQGYINQIARRIVIIQKAQKAKEEGRPPGASPPGSPVVSAHVAQAGKSAPASGTKLARTKLKQAAAGKPKTMALPSDKPLWPVLLGVSVFVGVLSFFSRRGQALMHRRLAHN